METITFSTLRPPIRARNIQDFPAPFLPSNPVTFPVEEVIYPPVSTVFSPNRTTTLSTINLWQSISQEGYRHKDDQQYEINGHYGFR